MVQNSRKTTTKKRTAPRAGISGSVIPADPSDSNANKAVTECLQRLLRTGIGSRAILLSGPRGIGKTSLARAVAHALLCAESEDDAHCGTCGNCVAFDASRHPDAVVIDNADDRIGIDTIRELTRTFSQRAVLAPRHVAVIDRAERMTEEASNAFLKSLEEPAGNTVYLLTTNAIDLLPKTVVSRCVVFHLTTAPVDALTETLTDAGVPKRDARSIAVFTDGKPAAARHLAANPADFEEATQDASALIDLIGAPTHRRIALVETVAEKRDGVQQMLTVIERWESVLHRMLRATIGMADHGPDAARLTSCANALGSSRSIVPIVDSLGALRTRILASGNIRLNLESFALHLPHVRP